MYFSEISHDCSVIDDICLASRMQIWLARLWIISLFSMHSHFVKEFLNHAFHAEEVAISVHAQRKLHSFFWKFYKRQRLWKVYISQFVQPYILVSSIIIGSQRHQHSIQGCGTHDAVILSKRIDDLYGLAKQRILRYHQFIEHFRTLERIGHTLAESAEFRDIAGYLFYSELKGEFSCRSLPPWKGSRNVVITIESGNLFRQVSHTEQIMAEGWRDHFIASLIISQANLLKVSDHFFFGDIRAKKIVDRVRVKQNSYRLLLLAVNIYHSPDNSTGSQFFYQLAGAVDCRLGVIGIQPFLKLAGSIRTKSHLFAGLTDIGSVKAGCLEKHCLNIVCDHGVLSAHDSCNTDGLLAIADHQHGVIHLPFLSV